MQEPRIRAACTQRAGPRHLAVKVVPEREIADRERQPRGWVQPRRSIESSPSELVLLDRQAQGGGCGSVAEGAPSISELCAVSLGDGYGAGGMGGDDQGLERALSRRRSPLDVRDHPIEHNPAKDLHDIGESCLLQHLVVVDSG